MPRRNFYVTEADAQLLDSLPPGIFGAHILRDAIARYRRHGEECRHDHLEAVCTDCGHRQAIDAHPVDTSSGGEAAQAG